MAFEVKRGGDDDRTRLDRLKRLYWLALGRPGDFGGLDAFLGQLRDGVTLAKIADEFVSSDEFRDRWRSDGDGKPPTWSALHARAHGPAATEALRSRRGAALDAVQGLGAQLAGLIEAEPDAPPLTLDRPSHMPIPNSPEGYRLWLTQNEPRSDLDRRRAREVAAGWSYRPRLSFLLAGEVASPEDLGRLITSITAQTYDQVELIIVGWPGRKVARLIRSRAKAGAPMRLIRCAPWRSPEHRLSLAVEAAWGEFVALTEETDVWAPGAARSVVEALQAVDPPSLIYGDEDRIDHDGRRSQPWFKTAWDPDAMLALDGFGRALFTRKSVLQAASTAEGPTSPNRTYPLMLRVSEQLAGKDIVHVPAVLLHRAAETAAPAPSDVEARRSAVSAHLARTGAADCDAIAVGEVIRVVRPLPDPAPLVSIIIPTRDRADLLRPCVDGLLNRTDYPNLEVLIVDNNSREAETEALLSELRSDARVRVLPYSAPFNWGAINNFAVEQARGAVIVLLNNDTEVMEPGWLREMTAQALRPEVGIVGATLLYRDRTVQHAGIVLGPRGQVEHIGRRLSEDDRGHGGRLRAIRAASAVTGACLAMRKTVYDELGGVEAAGLQVTWSDSDLGLKAWSHGYRVLMTPYARLFHLELATRGSDARPAEAARFIRERDWMRARWGARLDHDPYFPGPLTFDMKELYLDTSGVTPRQAELEA
jgi:GT2 family glycosyltransferase